MVCTESSVEDVVIDVGSGDTVGLDRLVETVAFEAWLPVRPGVRSYGFVLPARRLLLRGRERTVRVACRGQAAQRPGAAGDRPAVGSAVTAGAGLLVGPGPHQPGDRVCARVPAELPPGQYRLVASYRETFGGQEAVTMRVEGPLETAGGDAAEQLCLDLPGDAPSEYAWERGRLHWTLGLE